MGPEVRAPSSSNSEPLEANQEPSKKLVETPPSSIEFESAMTVSYAQRDGSYTVLLCSSARPGA
jgi:hypothetical protein